MSKKVKIFAIVVGIIAVAILAFSYLGNNAPVANTTGLSTTAGTAVTSANGTVPSGNFLQVLSTIDSITLDTSIFSNAGYKALRDFPLSLGTAVIGRQNPFAPIGSDSTGTTTVAPIQVQTLTPAKITSTSAEFGALVTTGSTAASTVVFQYGLNDTLGSATTPVKVTTSGTALFSVTGLTPATTYYVQAVAVQGSSTATGTIMNFITAPAQKR
ncbi:MAG: hypothetical protein JWL92_513 [Candidatus Nomurabacteria bacterium]|nr:hypothetical protein [Candidatus Nomurabacteria bacterium]